MGGKVQRVATAVATGGASEVARKVAKDLAPEIPVAQSPEVQKAAAEAEVDAKQMKDINLKNSGVASTMMGGSVLADNSNIKKKKLLGE